MRNWLALFLIGLIAACGGGGDAALSGAGGGSIPGGGTSQLAQLRVWVTDAPFPFASVDSATVVIREVRVHERTTDSWSTVFSGSREIDLVPLTNGVELLLVDATVPVGTYDQVRLIVDAGEVVLKPTAVVQDDHVFNTADGDLFFPSGAQTGIKVKIENDIVVTTQLSSDLLLDFDLSRNFVFNGPVTHAPGVKRVLFTPSVRALNVSTAGSVAVTVLSDNVTPANSGDDFPIEAATVRLLDGSATVVATGTTGADGKAVVSVVPGTYDVEIEASGHTSKTVQNVAVVLANLSAIGDVTLVASGEIGGVVLSDAATDMDPSDDVVVAGATVELRAAGAAGTPLATTTTDASGMWRFDDLDAGDYDVTVIATGFVSQTVEDIAAELTTPGYTILLEALTGDLTGTVTVPDGTDVTSIEIRISNAAGVVVKTINPAADGTYTATLATGSYRIVFDDGVAPQNFDRDIEGASPPPTPVTLNVTFE